MSCHVVQIKMHLPTTRVNGWHKRRLQKMVKATFQCLAFAEPSGLFEVNIYPAVRCSGIPGIDTYTLDVSVEMPDEKLQAFLRYAKEVKYFHSVFHTVSVPSDTIQT